MSNGAGLGQPHLKGLHQLHVLGLHPKLERILQVPFHRPGIQHPRYSTMGQTAPAAGSMGRDKELSPGRVGYSREDVPGPIASSSCRTGSKHTDAVSPRAKCDARPPRVMLGLHPSPPPSCPFPPVFKGIHPQDLKDEGFLFFVIFQEVKLALKRVVGLMLQRNA